MTLDDFTTAFVDQYFGVRLTSVGEPDGNREGSLKLGGEPGSEIIDPTPPPAPDPVNVANVDYLTVTEDEVFSLEPDGFDFLDSGAASVLANDTTDGGSYTGLVETAGGGAPGIANVLTGSNGGYMIVYEDGSVDFSATFPGAPVGDFDILNDGEQAVTTFDYSIAGGSTASIVITVLGQGAEDDLGDPPPIDPELDPSLDPSLDPFGPLG